MIEESDFSNEREKFWDNKALHRANIGATGREII
jgi:hypothetical protein